jgi:hypothetical protein
MRDGEHHDVGDQVANMVHADPQISPAQAMIAAGAITRLGMCGLIVPALTSCV